MKTSSIALTLAAAAMASAQEEPYYNITTAPFYLVVTSEDGGVNDTISACHVGAAIESLCLSNAGAGDAPEPLAGAEFQFNTSIYSQAPEPSFGVPGILTWWLNTSTLDIPSSAAFGLDPTSNLATFTLSPGSDDATQLAFNSQDELTLQAYVPGENYTGSYQEFYRWYACDTSYSSYQYNNLVWGLGAGKPDNPTTIGTLTPLPILLTFVPFCHANRGYADELICSITSDHFNLTLASDGASLAGNTFSAYPILIVTFSKDNFMNAQDPIDWEAERPDRDTPSCVKIQVKSVILGL
ncbi:unnamed protein product [Alternaria alternata]